MEKSDIHARYINFYTDFAFKKLFGTEINKEFLISFLNALFDGKEEIVDLQYLNSEQLGTAESDRKAFFDVYCRNTRGERFIVEMQKAEQQFFKDRSVYYATFPIRDQAKKGNDWNYELKKVYTIGIMNFSFDQSDPNYYHHEVKLMDTRTKEVFFEKLVFIYLEMPKFTKHPKELVTTFDKWMYVIRNLAVLEERPAELREKIFAHLFEVAEIACLNKVETDEYERSLKNYRDWYSVVSTAEKKGREEGRKEGREEGLEIGREEKQLEIARNLKSLGVPIETIKQATALTDEELNTL